MHEIKQRDKFVGLKAPVLRARALLDFTGFLLESAAGRNALVSSGIAMASVPAQAMVTGWLLADLSAL